MSFRALGRMALAGGFALMFVGAHQAHAHETVNPPAKPELLTGDEPSDAMTTGTTSSSVPAQYCGADKTPLRMPFAEQGHPDEAP